MFNISIIGIFVFKEMISDDTIISSSSIGAFLMQLENVVVFLALLFSTLAKVFRMLDMYL